MFFLSLIVLSISVFQVWSGQPHPRRNSNICELFRLPNPHLLCAGDWYAKSVPTILREAVYEDSSRPIDEAEKVNITKIKIFLRGVFNVPEAAFTDFPNLQTLELIGVDRLGRGGFNKRALIGLPKLENLEVHSFSINEGIDPFPSTIKDCNLYGNVDGQYPVYLQNQVGMTIIHATLELASIPVDAFQKSASTLKYIKLSGNQLTNIDVRLFRNLRALEMLNLAANGLTTIPAGAFDDLVSLQDFTAHSNPFTCLPADLFKNQQRLTTIFLAGTPIVGSGNWNFNSPQNFKEAMTSRNATC